MNNNKYILAVIRKKFSNTLKELNLFICRYFLFFLNIYNVSDLFKSKMLIILQI